MPEHVYVFLRQERIYYTPGVLFVKLPFPRSREST